MTARNFTDLSAAVILLAIADPLPAQEKSPAEPFEWKVDQQRKELHIPAEVSRVPDGNDYNDPESDYSFARRVEGPNVAIFWHKEYGDVPMNNPDGRRTFNPYRMLEESERYYRFYVNEME